MAMTTERRSQIMMNMKYFMSLRMMKIMCV